MILALTVGLPVMLACLAMQAGSLVLGSHYLAVSTRWRMGRHPWRVTFTQVAVLMVVLMLGNVVQIAIWAVLYRLLGAFDDFETALYFSGVTFTTLGYGDEVLSGRMRLLSPLQAANGVMMFGVTTAAFMATVERVGSKWAERRNAGRPN